MVLETVSAEHGIVVCNLGVVIIVAVSVKGWNGEIGFDIIVVVRLPWIHYARIVRHLYEAEHGRARPYVMPTSTTNVRCR